MAEKNKYNPHWTKKLVFKILSFFGGTCFSFLVVMFFGEFFVMELITSMGYESSYNALESYILFVSQEVQTSEGLMKLVATFVFSIPILGIGYFFMALFGAFYLRGKEILYYLFTNKFRWSTFKLNITQQAEE